MRKPKFYRVFKTCTSVRVALMTVEQQIYLDSGSGQWVSVKPVEDTLGFEGWLTEWKGVSPMYDDILEMGKLSSRLDVEELVGRISQGLKDFEVAVLMAEFKKFIGHEAWDKLKVQ